jgi:hypothetical protein
MDCLGFQYSVHSNCVVLVGKTHYRMLRLREKNKTGEDQEAAPSVHIHCLKLLGKLTYKTAELRIATTVLQIKKI